MVDKAIGIITPAGERIEVGKEPAVRAAPAFSPSPEALQRGIDALYAQMAASAWTRITPEGNPPTYVNPYTGFIGLGAQSGVPWQVPPYTQQWTYAPATFRYVPSAYVQAPAAAVAGNVQLGVNGPALQNLAGGGTQLGEGGFGAYRPVTQARNDRLGSEPQFNRQSPLLGMEVEAALRVHPITAKWCRVRYCRDRCLRRFTMDIRNGLTFRSGIDFFYMSDGCFTDSLNHKLRSQALRLGQCIRQLAGAVCQRAAHLLNLGRRRRLGGGGCPPSEV